MATSTIVVPRLGCAMISAATAAVTSSTGRSVTRVSCMRWRRRPSRSATNSSSASLASSDGWMPIGPRPSQRVAPLAPTPTPGTSTRASSPTDDEQAGRGQHPPAPVVDPLHAEQHHRAQHRPQRLALHVVPGRAVLGLGGHRRSRQHHDQADEVEGDDDAEQAEERRGRAPRRPSPAPRSNGGGDVAAGRSRRRASAPMRLAGRPAGRRDARRAAPATGPTFGAATWRDALSPTGPGTPGPRWARRRRRAAAGRHPGRPRLSRQRPGRHATGRRSGHTVARRPRSRPDRRPRPRDEGDDGTARGRASWTRRRPASPARPDGRGGRRSRCPGPRSTLSGGCLVVGLLRHGVGPRPPGRSRRPARRSCGTSRSSPRRATAAPRRRGGPGRRPRHRLVHRRGRAPPGAGPRTRRPPRRRRRRWPPPPARGRRPTASGDEVQALVLAAGDEHRRGEARQRGQRRRGASSPSSRRRSATPSARRPPVAPGGAGGARSAASSAMASAVAPAARAVAAAASALETSWSKRRGSSSTPSRSRPSGPAQPSAGDVPVGVGPPRA